MSEATAYRLVISLPAYNEERNLPDLLRDIRACALPAGVVLVVDDGSTDRTAAIAGEWGERLPVVLHRHRPNQGLGAAIRSILREADPLLTTDGVLVIMDADGSHRPEQIPALLAKLAEGFDVVIASRYTADSRVRGVPWHRRMLSGGVRVLARLLLGVKEVRDFSSGYRAIRASFLREAQRRYGGELATEPGFAVTLEVLIKLLRCGARVAEIGLDLRYDLKQGASKIRLTRTVVAYFRLLGRLRRLKPAP